MKNSGEDTRQLASRSQPWWFSGILLLQATLQCALPRSKKSSIVLHTISPQGDRTVPRVLGNDPAGQGVAMLEPLVLVCSFCYECETLTSLGKVFTPPISSSWPPGLSNCPLSAQCQGVQGLEFDPEELVVRCTKICGKELVSLKHGGAAKGQWP